MADLLKIGPAGWVRYEADDRDDDLYVRLTEAADGRLIVADVLMQFDDPPGARTLRAVAERGARVDALANTRYRDAIRKRLDRDDPGLRDAIAGIRFVGIPTVDDLADLGIGTVFTDLALERPDVRPYPDEHWQAVAEAYRKASAVSSRPAVLIAQASDVPVATVHRWVAEARERDHLAPGRTGKAG